MSSTVKFQGVKVKLTGDDGNAFYVLNRVRKALRAAGCDEAGAIRGVHGRGDER